MQKMVVNVKVSDLSRAVAFYTQVLGLSCCRQEKDWASITIGDAEIHLYLYDGVNSGVEFYVNDIDKAVADLKTRGVKFFSDPKQPNLVRIDSKGITEFPWGRTAFFNDSEGNSLALIRDF
ncbi:MAG: VOC family protein [Candidatus Vogelbacteria bacterium]|nr:VOC family protein [Candidatus Vogelbacteria bacterium]